MKRLAVFILCLVCCYPAYLFGNKVYNKIIFHACASGPRESKKIALTFDDGPGASTEKVLEILKEKDVKATFFMLGSQVEKNPQLAKKIFEAGHEVQNHTYSHINFKEYKEKDKYEKMKDELLRAEESIKKYTGVKPYLVRFPHGYSKDDAKKIASENGYKMMNWTFCCDYTNKLTAEEMHKQYASRIKGGAVFLMHDSWNYDGEMPNEKILSFLGDLIDEIRAKGYELVTVSELKNGVYPTTLSLFQCFRFFSVIYS